MVKPSSPRDTAEFIAKISKNVKISYDNVQKLSVELYSALLRDDYKLSLWKEQLLHPKTANDFAVNWIFLVDSLNFSFWPDPGQEYAVTYKNVEYTGYWALCAVINRALDQGIPMVNPEYYSDLSMDQVKKIFRAHRIGKPDEPIEMPLLEERANIMKENGAVLVKKFSNNFVTMVVKAKNSVKTLLKMVIENFPSFRDALNYHGELISFYNRAQLLIADIYSCHEGQGLGKFDDIDELTMFSNHIHPQCLYYYGVIIYRDELLRRLAQGQTFKYGDPDEVEIRGVTIHAVELLKHAVLRLSEMNETHVPIKLNSVIVDFFLWDMRRNKEKEVSEAIICHKTRSIHY